MKRPRRRRRPRLRVSLSGGARARATWTSGRSRAGWPRHAPRLHHRLRARSPSATRRSWFARLRRRPGAVGAEAAGPALDARPCRRRGSSAALARRRRPVHGGDRVRRAPPAGLVRARVTGRWTHVVARGGFDAAAGGRGGGGLALGHGALARRARPARGRRGAFLRDGYFRDASTILARRPVPARRLRRTRALGLAQAVDALHAAQRRRDVVGAAARWRAQGYAATLRALWSAGHPPACVAGHLLPRRRDRRARRRRPAAGGRRAVEGRGDQPGARRAWRACTSERKPKK